MPTIFDPTDALTLEETENWYMAGMQYSSVSKDNSLAEVIGT